MIKTRKRWQKLDTLVLLHLALSTILIIIFYFSNKALIPTIAYGIIILSFPIGGILVGYILFSRNSRLFPLESKYDPASYFNDEEDKLRFTKTLNADEETRIMPIRKALELEDYTIRRETILNLIKKDTNDYTVFMKIALKNQDTETSHYAASSILHSKRQQDNKMDKISQLYKKDSTNPDVIIKYADELMSYINNDYLDDDIKSRYVKENIKTLKRIVDEKIDLNSKYLYNLIDLLLSIKDFKNVYIYCDLLIDSYPNTEEKYVFALKTYYVMKDFNKFNIILEKFRSSGISFSNETIKIIRFWLGG